MPTTRGMSPPARPPAAAHAGPAGGRARAGTVWLRFFRRARTHLVESRLARAFAQIPTPRVFAARPSPQGGGRSPRYRDRLGGGIVEHRELGRAQALNLVAQARRFLEVEIGGGRAHALL